MREIFCENRLREWSRQVKIRDHWHCQKCNEQDRQLLDSHHIKPKELFPELAYEIDNGETLCLWCHFLAHKGNLAAQVLILIRFCKILFKRLYRKELKEKL